MPIGAAIGANVAKTAIGAAGAAGAANAAKTAASQAIGFDKSVYSDAQQNLSPYINNGSNASNALAGLLGTGGNAAQSQAAWNNYLNSTNYGFNLNQGLKGLSYANAPGYGSGATGKALVNYAQNAANNALTGYEGMLGGQAALGSQSALGLGSLGNQTAGLVNNALGFGANAQGNAAIGTANGINSGLNDILGLFPGGSRTSTSFGGGAPASSWASQAIGAGVS